MNVQSEHPKQLDPKEVGDLHRFLEYEQALDRTWRLDRLVELIDRPGLAVCDVGGASGLFLDALAERARHPFRGTVLEVDERYATVLTRPDLLFLHASIVANDLPPDHYDIVTFQHVLHHLVGDSVQATLALQQRGLLEMMRITKPGGYLVFEELVNRVKPFARLVFLLSRTAVRFRVRVKFFDVGTVVVSFPTPGEVHTLVQRASAVHPLRVMEADYIPWQMPWRFRLTLLMSTVGSAVYVMRKLGPTK